MPKTKPKTKGVAAPTSDGNKALIETSTAPAPSLNTSKRGLKVFSRLFHGPAASEPAPSETSWTDFLSAMGSVGFTARKVYGSVWRFSPDAQLATALGTERPINFHSPHAHVKLSPWVSRRYGRRLARAYGLDAACFALAA